MSSEVAFTTFCQSRNIRCRPIPCGSSPTPDFELLDGDSRVIVEVKSLLPNEQDKSILEAVAGGNAMAFHDDSCSRLRRHIRMRQLKRHSLLGMPTMLVVVEFQRASSVDSEDVLGAMYGEETVTIGVPDPPFSTRPRILGVRRAGGRCQAQLCTSMSALGVLSSRLGDMQLRVYHNQFARHSLPQAHLQGDGLVHYEIVSGPSQMPTWSRVGPST